MKILLISNNEQIAHEVNKLLIENHMEVVLCETLRDALKRTYLQEYNLIIIHRNILAEKDADEAVKKLAEFLPVVLITDAIKQLEAIEAYDIGIIDYIVEPIVKQDFITRIYLAFKRKHKIDKRETVKHSLTHLKASFDALFENSPDAIIHFDMKHKIVDINPQFSKQFGYERSEVVGKYINHIIDPHGHLTEYASFAILAGNVSLYEDTIRYHKNGKPIEVMLKGVPLCIGGVTNGGYAIYTDITHRKKAENALHDQLHFVQKLMDTIPNPIFYKDISGAYIGCNEAFEHYIGIKKEELIGKSTYDIAPPELASTYEDKDKQLFQSPGTQTYEYKVQKNGSHRDVIFNKATYNNANGEVAGLVGIILDITERKELEEKNLFLAYHDPLTGLLNTRSLHEQFNKTLDSLESTHKEGAVLFIDIDRFKIVNDSLGHHVGDVLLQEIASRITKCIPDFPVFRPGGDEFIVLVDGTDKVVNTTQAIIDEITRPFTIVGRELSITASIGISLYPQDGNDINTLFSNADTAMYRAKAKGKNQYCFYTEDMNARMLENLTLENELRRALEKKELELYYQIQTNSLTEEVIGVEALIRWNNPMRGMINPGVFIPIAEETGLILSIGDWVLRQACHQNKGWQKQGLKAIPVAVNVSPFQFMQADFVEVIESILRESELEPKYLDLEITESTAMSDIEDAVIKVERLRQLGVQVSIDDFGTGYSSLNHFRRLPINKLKIDKSFISRILQDNKDAAIVDTIIVMARRLGLDIIAEGVETKEHMQYLQKRNCNYAQGFLFSKPITANEFEKMLHKQIILN